MRSDYDRAVDILTYHPHVFREFKYSHTNKMFFVEYTSGRRTWLSASSIVKFYDNKATDEELNIDDLLDLYNIATRLENHELKEEVKKELQRRTGHGFKESK